MSPSHDRVLSAPGISFCDGGACVGPGRATAAMIEGGEGSTENCVGACVIIRATRSEVKNYSWV